MSACWMIVGWVSDGSLLDECLLDGCLLDDCWMGVMKGYLSKRLLMMSHDLNFDSSSSTRNISSINLLSANASKNKS